MLEARTNVLFGGRFDRVANCCYRALRLGMCDHVCLGVPMCDAGFFALFSAGRRGLQSGLGVCYVWNRSATETGWRTGSACHRATRIGKCVTLGWEQRYTEPSTPATAAANPHEIASGSAAGIHTAKVRVFQQSPRGCGMSKVDQIPIS